MKRTQHFLSLGVLFIILGIILLVTSGVIEGTIFFIFPFFIFSASNPISIFLFLIFVIFILRIMKRSTSDFFGQSDVRYDNDLTEEYLSVGSKCEYCLTPIPVNASFCPSCGNKVDYDKMSNH